MNKLRTTCILFSFLLIFGILPVISSTSQLRPASLTPLSQNYPQSTMNEQGNLDLYDTIFLNSYYCHDFEGAPLKVWRMMEDFYFVFDSTTLHYGIYLGAMFVEAGGDNVSLVIYAFVKTLTEYYVSSLDMTFTFNLTGSYRGTDFQQNGTRVDTSPWIMGGACQCDFSLYSIEFIKDLHFYDLSLTIIYSLTSSEFSENDVFSCTELLPAASEAEIRFQQAILAVIIIVAILGIIGILITSIVIIHKRRRWRAYDRLDDHRIFSRTEVTRDESPTPIPPPPIAQRGDSERSTSSELEPSDVERSGPISSYELLGEERPESIISRETTAPEIPQEERMGKYLDDLKYGSRGARLEAIEFLGTSGNVSAVSALLDILLHEGDAELRAKAAISLGLIGNTEIMPILRRAMNEDSDPEVRDSIADALDLLEGFDDL